METRFYHHPDGLITIADGVDTLTISLAEFLTYEPGYTLASPYVGRLYIPGVKHALFEENGKQVGGVFPWTEGDGYIANLSDYINEHENPTLTLSEAKNEKIAALNSYARTIREGGINLFATTMLSFGVSATALLSYQLATATPVGFYLKDSDGAHVSLSLAQLQSYNDAIVELHLLCDENRDDHEDAINALGSVGAVDAYDITTGWPTVPYTP